MNTPKFQYRSPVYRTTMHKVLIIAICGRFLYMSHRISVHTSAPATFISRKLSSITRVCRCGFHSRASPCVTRKLLITPSATTRANTVPRRHLIRRTCVKELLTVFGNRPSFSMPGSRFDITVFIGPSSSRFVVALLTVYCVASLHLLE